MFLATSRVAWRLGFILGATLVLSGCSGRSASMLPAQSIACSGCTFVYATTNSGSIAEFPLRAPASVGMPNPVAGPANSTGMAIVGMPNRPQSPYLYVSDPEANAIRVYAISPVDGALSAASIGPFPIASADGTPGEMTTLGAALYVATSAGRIEAFAVNDDGSLTSIPGSPFAAGAGLSHLVTVPSCTATNASCLYAADTDDPTGGISAFTIAANGALTAIAGSPFATAPGGGPAGFFDGGRFLYVALKNANAIAGFEIAGDGSLTPVAGSPFPAGRGTFSLGGVDGFLIATNNVDGTFSSYSINVSTGALAAVAGSPFPGATTSGDTYYMGAMFFVPDAQSDQIVGFESVSTGAVQPLETSGFQTNGGPVALTAVFFPVVDPP